MATGNFELYPYDSLMAEHRPLQAFTADRGTLVYDAVLEYKRIVNMIEPDYASWFDRVCGKLHLTASERLTHPDHAVTIYPFCRHIFITPGIYESSDLEYHRHALRALARHGHTIMPWRRVINLATILRESPGSQNI